LHIKTPSATAILFSSRWTRIWIDNDTESPRLGVTEAVIGFAVSSVYHCGHEEGG
jgi:hypothetical protein